MAMLGKNDPLYFLDIDRVYPSVKSLVVSSPIDKSCLVPFLLRVRTILSIQTPSGVKQ